MRQNVPWNLEGLDPDTRDAAREAARRAGMSLDEWLNVTISDRASRVFAESAGSHQPVRRRSSQNASYDELDSIAAKISKVTRGKASSSSRALDTVMTTVSAEADRRARESASKTAEALDSVARWIERAEDRMNESTRAATEGARMAIERHDRTANVLGEALGLMTKRLDEIERKVVDGQQPSVMAALKAVEKVEQHLAALGDAQRSKAQDAQIQTALRGFEERIAAITEKLAETPRGAGRRGLAIADEVRGAVAEIRSRQSLLDGRTTQRSHDDVLAALRGDIAKLATQLETIRPERNGDIREPDELRREIDALQRRIGGLATREEITALERTLAELTQEAVRASDAGRSEELAAVTKLITRVEGELSGLSETVAGGVHERIARDYGALSAKIDAISEAGVDPAVVKGIVRELEAVRALFSELADADRVRELADQVREMSRQMGQMARSQIDAIEFATLRSAVEDIRGAVKASRTSQASAELMVDQFAQLTRRLDELPDRIPPADLSLLSAQYDSVAQKIADLAAEQPRREIAQLSDRVEKMARTLEDVSGRLTRSQAQLMANEIAAMSSDLTLLPHADRAADIAEIGRQFEMLSAKVDSLIDRPVMADLGPVSRQIEALEKKLSEGLGARGAGGAASSEIIGRLDALTSKLDSLGSGPKSIEGDELKKDFAREFERLQRNLQNAFVTSQAVTPVGFETLIERIDRLDAKLRQPQDRGDLKPLEDMLSQLAARLDAAERPNAGLDTVDALEGQIGEIMKRLERSESSDPVLSSLERSMSDLMSQIEVMRDGAVEAAERAARAAVADTLGALPKDENRDAEDLDFLARSLSDLKASQSEAARLSVDKMGSVQNTLDKLVERLAMLEEKGRHQQRQAIPRAASPLATDRNSFAFETGSRPKRKAEEAAQRTRSDRSAVRSREDAARAHLAGAPGQSLLDDADRPISATGTLGNDVPLEPGSGRPNPGQPRSGGPATDDASDIKASFIAAARRAAQTAAAEAAASVGDDPVAHPREPIARHAADAPGVSGRMRQMIANKRRPLLMGVAAILLAMGAFQISARFIIEDGRTGLAAGASPQIEQTADIGLPPASPPLVPSARSVAASSPESTASIDINTLLATGAFGGAQTGVIGADAFISGLERNASGGEAEVPPHRDGAPAVVEERIPSHRLFPSIVSADEIPDSAGPAPLRDAVLAGDINAVYELASMAADGRGMARDNGLAAKLFERAAAHGLVPAQYRIGNHYEKGLGVTRDFALASLWYQRAAESGNSRAMHNLAVLLAEGVNGEPDYERAVGWFSRAAEYGVRDSQYNLAVLLARGLGAQQDLAGSYTWFAIAATQGDADAGSKRDEVAARLSESELALAKAKVELWRPKVPRAEANEVQIPAHGWNDAPKAQISMLEARG